MPEAKRPLKVFLCHAHADRDPVRGLYARLTKDGVDAWLDKEKLLPGQDWELEIRKAVREADVVVVCLSKQFNQVGFRQKEVRLALDTAMEKPEGEIFIIPARLEECDNLESLRKWHWVDLFEDDGYEMLKRALKARADRIDATLQINSAARENKQREVDEKIERERVIKEAREKQEIEVAKKEKIKKEIQREVDNQLKKAKRELQWERFYTKIRYWLSIARIYALPNTLFLIGIAFAISMIVYYSENIPALNNILNPTPQPNQISSEATTSLLTKEITDNKGVDMVLVPAGEFTMGSDNYSEESPAHTVYLDSFYMDKYEVTNVFYKACVNAGVCKIPQQTKSYFRSAYYGNPEYENYPVLFVNWNQAKTYCEWRGGDLPTEAQWEKAARGTDGRTYPWGEGIDCSKSNYWDANNDNGCGELDTTAVGSYKNGVSPYGIYDMAGNAQEWVADWYSETYYQNSPLSNPFGPNSGQYRVLRSGSVALDGVDVRSSDRSASSPDKYEVFGFRCTRDANP